MLCRRAGHWWHLQSIRKPGSDSETTLPGEPRWGGEKLNSIWWFMLIMLMLPLITKLREENAKGGEKSGAGGGFTLLPFLGNHDLFICLFVFLKIGFLLFEIRMSINTVVFILAVPAYNGWWWFHTHERLLFSHTRAHLLDICRRLAPHAYPTSPAGVDRQCGRLTE